MRLLSTGAVGSAIAASICCIGPLALAFLGLGGGALLVALAPYRPLFIGVCVLFLGAAFYLAYGPPRVAQCAPDSVCAPVNRTKQRAFLWIITGFVLLVVTFPYYSKLLF